MIIEFPLPPNLSQHGGGWRKRYFAKVAWLNEASLGFVVQGLHFPKEPWSRVRIQMHFRLWKKMDDDNLAHRQKFILDFLKKADGGLGFMVDDSPDYVELGPATWEVNRRDQGVTITVEPDRE